MNARTHACTYARDKLLTFYTHGTDKHTGQTNRQLTRHTCMHVRTHVCAYVRTHVHCGRTGMRACRSVMSVCERACMSVRYIRACVRACLYLCLSVCMSVRLCERACLPACLSVCLSVVVCLTVCPVFPIQCINSKVRSKN